MNLYAVSKITVADKKECDIVYDGHLAGAARYAHSSRTIIRVFSWILFSFAIVTTLLGIVFVLAALYKYFAT